MARILDIIRDAPPEYPWDMSARAALRARIDPRWRAYCLAQAAAALMDALAGANQPFVTDRVRRDSCRSNLRRGRSYLGMAAKR